MRTTVRWTVRTLGLLLGLVVLAACDPTPHTNLLVTTTVDGVDADPGDGICEMTVGAGDCSLRAALDEVNAGTPHPAVVTLPAGTYELSPGAAEDENATGDLDLVAAVTIEGAGATIDPGAADRAFHVRAGGSLGLKAATIRDGQADTGGAIHVDEGASAVVAGVTFTGNVATAAQTCWIFGTAITSCSGEGGGGAIWSAGTVVVTSSSFVDNRASGGGTCISTSQPPVQAATCEFADGGAVHGAEGTVAIRTSTFAGNSVRRGAGGAVQGGVVEASTFVDNWIDIQSVPGVGRSLSQATISGSALTGVGPMCDAVTSEGSNVATDATCDPQPTDLPSTDPLLGPLADNGGATPTFLPGANSPLLDAVPVGTAGRCDGTIATDQRGSARPAGAACDIGAVEGASAAPVAGVALVVDDPGDAPDAAPGDRACTTAAGGCTLRAAVDEANAWERFASTIEIADGVDPVLGVPGTAEDANASGDLDVRVDLTIVGGGATVDGAGIDRVFEVHPRVPVHNTAALGGRATLRLEDLVVTGGSAPTGGGVRADGDVDLTLTAVTLDGNVATDGGGALALAAGTTTIDRSTLTANGAPVGGAVLLDGGTLVVRDSRFATNEATNPAGSARGGAIRQTAGTATVERSLFEANRAASTADAPAGGAVEQADGTATITNTTFSGNRATGTYYSTGGAVAASGTMQVRLSTVVGGSAAYGAGIARVTYSPGPFTVTGTVLDVPGSDCHGAIATGGHNVSSDATCAGLTGSGDLLSTPAQLGPLADNGGPTASHLPAAGSPVVDRLPFAGSVGCNGSIPTDQRGVPRPQGLACDSGAVERTQTAVVPLSLTVDDAGDALDADPGDGVCETGDGRCTLRAAIGEANAWPTDDVITVAPGIDPVLAIAGSGEDANATGDLDITDELVIQGGGATLDAADLDRAFHVRASTTISDLTVTGGLLTASGTHGGGILHVAGALDLIDVRVTGNRTTGSSGRGGGISSTGGSASIVGSTFDDNAVLGDFSVGGAISTSAPLEMSHSTVTLNAAENGSAINASESAQVHLRAVTLTRNTSRSLSTASGSSTITVAGSAIEAYGDTCASGARVVSDGHNVVEGTTCALAGPGDQQATDPEVAPLTDQGGPTPTQLPFAGAPVVDAIPAGTAGLCDASTPVDQRGVARPVGLACDAGAVEGQGPAPMGSSAFTVDSATDAPDTAPGDGVCASTAGGCTLRAAIDEANRQPSADQVTIAPGVDLALSLEGIGEDANRAGDLDVLDHLVLVGSGATLDGLGLDRVLDVRDADLTMRDVVVTGGQARSGTGYAGNRNGGGLRASASKLVLEDVAFVANTGFTGGAIDAPAPSVVSVARSSFTTNVAGNGGGGAISTDSLTMDASTFTQNRAEGSGGAIAARSFAITGSTFDRNRTALDGGAVFGTSRTEGATIQSSTFVGNSARQGGAVMGGFVMPPMVITGSTFTGNASYGATLAGVNTGTVRVGGSVLDDAGRECHVTVRSNGYNVVNDDTCTTVASDQIGVSALLGPLADNGGPTATRFPQPGSPALDAIPFGTAGLCDAATPVDQRGVARPQGSGCDAGAVEVEVSAPGAPGEVVQPPAPDDLEPVPGDQPAADEPDGALDEPCAAPGGGCQEPGPAGDGPSWPTPTAPPGGGVVTVVPGSGPPDGGEAWSASGTAGSVRPRSSRSG